MDLDSSRNSFSTPEISQPLQHHLQNKEDKSDRSFADLFVLKVTLLEGSHTGETAKRSENSKVMSH